MADPSLSLLLLVLLLTCSAGLFWSVYAPRWRSLRSGVARQRALVGGALKRFGHCESRCVTPTTESLSREFGNASRQTVEREEQAHVPAVAARVPSVPLAERAPPPVASRRLSELPLGGRARVLSIASACSGLQRRRLLDLGLVPGTVVSAELKGAAGGPTAYRIRGAVIALRRAQAEQIQISDA